MTLSERRIFVLTLLLCCFGIACRPAQPNTAEARDDKTGLQQPLTVFRQVVTSPSNTLTLQPGQEIKLPVRIENPDTETWLGLGRYPMTISYKWFMNAKMLPIEGERTSLPGPIGPGQALSADVRVVAPSQKGNYKIRITLVQEAVAWFMVNSNTFLELPVAVQ